MSDVVHDESARVAAIAYSLAMTYGGGQGQAGQGNGGPYSQVPPPNGQPTQPLPYGNASPYGTPPAYGTPPNYGQAAGYGQPVSYGQPVPYDQSGPYAAPYPGYGPPMGPYGPIPVDPYTGRMISPKSKAAAGLLQIFLGTLGIGRFYMGSTGIGVAQLLLTIVGWATSFILIGIPILIGVSIWALVDGIVILAGRPVDEHGRELR